MFKVFPIICIGFFLVGCSTAAIQVTENEGTCTLAGSLWQPTILGQPPATSDGVLDYRFDYQGERCNVSVMGNSGDIILGE